MVADGPSVPTMRKLTAQSCRELNYNRSKKLPAPDSSANKFSNTSSI